MDGRQSSAGARVARDAYGNGISGAKCIIAHMEVRLPDMKSLMLEKHGAMTMPGDERGWRDIASAPRDGTLRWALEQILLQVNKPGRHRIPTIRALAIAALAADTLPLPPTSTEPTMKGDVSQLLAPRLGSMHERLASDIPQLKRCQVWCHGCGHTERVDSANCLRRGWPKHCGYTMSVDSPAERTKP